MSAVRNDGAPYVFVANIYPKHVAPVTAKYLCGGSAACVSTCGSVIARANGAIAASLLQFGSRVISYDVFAFVLDLIADKDACGLTPADDVLLRRRRGRPQREVDGLE